MPLKSSAINTRSETALAWLKHLPVVLIGGLYLYVIGLEAARNGLWFDEITTYFVADVGSGGAIIDALLARADNHPPLDYLARHYSMSLLGPSEYAFRLPSILAMLVGTVSLYIFVLRRTSPLPALVAFAFPLTTFALRYSYEGRPYAFLMASMCLALLAWQLVTEKPTAVRLVFFTLSLSLGPHVHYFGVLNYLPLAAGELWRWREQRSISWPIVGCVVVSLAIDALLIPFVIHAADFATLFWTRVGVGTMFFVYGNLFADAIPALLAAAVGCAVMAYFFRDAPEAAAQPLAIPRHEVVAALVLCLVPVTTYMLKLVVTHAFADKYLINTVVGVALILAFLTAKLERQRRGYAIVIALSIVLWTGWKLAYWGRHMPAKPFSLPPKLVELIESATQPVAVFHSHSYFQTYFYLPPNLREKIYFISDLKLAVGHTGHYTSDLVIENLHSIVKLQAPNLCTFTKEHPRFLMVVESPTWVTSQLIEDGANLKIIEDTPHKSQIISVVTTRPSGCE